MHTIHIRQVELGDIAKLAELFDLYRQFYRKPSDIEGATQFLRARIANKESVIFVGENQARDLCGFAQLYPSFTSLRMGPSWVLNDLYVAQAFRRRGMGRLLMEAVHAFAESSGVRSISLETQVDNADAQAFYKALGYEAETGFILYSKTLLGS